MISDQIVMVLDDEPGVAKFCQAVLERAGLETITFLDARPAIGVLQQVNVDLLLVDIRMPHMDGFQVMEEARKLQPDMAILIMTGYGTVETATRALRMGANGLILKPFESAQELVDDVRQALRDRENKREFTRLQALRPLLQITERLFSETNPVRLVALILDSVLKLLACEHAGFYRHASRPGDKDFLKLVEGRGRPFPGEAVGFDGGPVSRADAWGAPYRVDRDSLDDEAMVEWVTSAGMAAVLCAPALRGSEENSVLLAGRGLDALPFTDADVELFGILARQAGVALENARLYAELRASLAQLQEQQQALLQTEKMAVIGRLTASIAHEVNNPLQAVRNCLHLVNREDLALEKRSEYLALAQDELQRLMDTVQQMLDFYRPSARQREPVDINDLIRTVLTLLAKQFQQGNIRVETQLAGKLPPLYLVRNQMQQVFFNVLLNAMEAMPDGGAVTIRTANQDQKIVIRIEDTGPGVPEETRHNLFEPFVSSKPQGTGLGLSVSYGILDAHGGTIELLEEESPPYSDTGAEKEKNGGAVFLITLPARQGRLKAQKMEAGAVE